MINEQCWCIHMLKVLEHRNIQHTHIRLAIYDTPTLDKANIFGLYKVLIIGFTTHHISACLYAAILSVILIYIHMVNRMNDWCWGHDSALLIRIYWAGDNLCEWDEFCYESCNWRRIDRSTCWPAVLRATTVPRMLPHMVNRENMYVSCARNRPSF